MNEKTTYGGATNQEIQAARSPASSTQLDDTYNLYKQDDAAHIDEQEAKSVLRLIDWHLVPLLMGTYCLQYLDKSSINFASVFGLKTVS